METTRTTVPAPTTGSKIKVGLRTYTVEAVCETGPNTRLVSGRGGNPVLFDIAAKCGKGHYMLGQRANGDILVVGSL